MASFTPLEGTATKPISYQRCNSTQLTKMNAIPADLAAELENQIIKGEKWAARNFFYSQIVVWTGITASIAAAIIAGMDQFPLKNTLLISSTSMSAVSATINKSLNFDKRSDWHYKLVAKLKGLLRALRHENAEPAKISKMFTEATESFECMWLSASNPEANDMKS